MTMTYKFIKGDLFDFYNTHYLVHCISADYALGAGIAKEIENRYHVKDKLRKFGCGKYPDCIKVGRIYNLVTKQRYFQKPTYESLEDSLYCLKAQVRALGTKNLAMPLIGCGLDRLDWKIVWHMIQDIFCEQDVNIVVVVRE